MPTPVRLADATIETPSPFDDVAPELHRSPSRPQARGRPREFEDRFRALPRVFSFFFFAWSSFFFLDVYVAMVVSPATPLGWMAAWRFVAAGAIAASWAIARRTKATHAKLNALEVLTFFGSTACLSMMAVRYGGIGSHYLPGVSLILVIQNMALPSRWKRALVMSGANLVAFPLVMLTAAAFDDEIRAQWETLASVAMFVQDYVLVVATAVGTSIGGHLIWAARRQVFQARRLGRYRLKARVGSGGMGEVWLAWDDTLKRDVALKILARQASSNALARFEREAFAASSLQSPHTIRVFDFGASDDGLWFIAMEHLEGADLATLVGDHGPLSPARAVRFARQACASLAEAHDAGIIHRDIKPANLFVTRAGDQFDLLKLLDFGIAKVAREEEDTTVTQAGWLAGTPAYMSPEVCSGTQPDARTDIYSLGAVIYFLLTGTPPFASDNVAAVMMAHVHEPPETPSQRLGALVPPDLEKVVLRCLEKRVEERFARVADLDAALARCAVGRSWTNDDARNFWATYRPRLPAPSTADVATENRRRR